MQIYLVRTKNGEDLVGIFVAHDERQLAALVDECSEPEDCEYVFMGPGGIMWEGHAVAVPLGPPEHDDGSEPDPMPWAEASITHDWLRLLFMSEKTGWSPIPTHGQPSPNRSKATGRVLPFRRR